MEIVLVALLKVPILGRWLERLCTWQFRLMAGAMRRARRHTVRPREWSNQELAKVAPAFTGAIINVSGWRDEDQRGRHYRDYFIHASSYTISNYFGARGFGQGIGDELLIDLEQPLPSELRQKYQVAFNHTTLEHIFDIQTAIENICALSSDVVVLVTPFLQSVHYEEGSFGDYWRPTPMCLNRILQSNGFTTLYQSANDTPWHYVYVFTVAARDPKRNIGTDLPLDVPLVGSRHFSV